MTRRRQIETYTLMYSYLFDFTVLLPQRRHKIERKIETFGNKIRKKFVSSKKNVILPFYFINVMSMKKACILVVLCLFAGMLFSSCRSSKPCPAYRSVTSVEQPASTTQPG